MNETEIVAVNGLPARCLRGLGILSSILCTLIVGPRVAWSADTAGQADNDKAQLEEVLVTARRHYVATDTDAGTKTAIPLIETPQSISVITQDELELLQIQNLEEATRYTTGIISGSYGPDQRFDWLTLRGFTPTEYLDGLQLPNAAVAEAQSRLDTYGLQQIEILKGPSSALYGAVPPGGLVEMTSKRPTDKEFGEVQAQVGTFHHYQAAFDVGGPIDSDHMLLFRLTSLFRDSDTQVDYVHDRRYFIAPAVTWNISSAATLTLLGHYQYDRTGTEPQYMPARGSLLPNPFGTLPTSRFLSEPDYDKYQRRTIDVGYDFNYRLDDHWSVHQNLKYTDLKVHYNTIYAQGLQADLRTVNRYTYLVNSSPSDTAVDTHAELHAASGAVEHQVLFGFDFRRSTDNSALGFDVGPSLDAFAPVYGQAVVNPAISVQNIIHQDQRGFYVQDHAKIGQLALTGSVREDQVITHTHDTIGMTYSEQRDSAFSYRGGANYLLDSGFAPYVTASKSFQPTIGNSFSGQSFKPTTGTSYEGGVKYQPPGISSLITLAAYRTTEQNALTPDANPQHLGFNVQTGEIRVQGVELEGTARLNDNLSLNAALTYTDAKTTMSNGPDLGKRILLVPQTQGSVFGDYTIRSGGLSGLGFGGGIRYVGNVYGDPTDQVNTAAFTLVDALVHYDLPNWRLSVNVNNLFDKVYLSSCYSLDSCTWGNRRTVLAAISRHW
jgi:iron complex outermembrane receptor protein